MKKLVTKMQNNKINTELVKQSRLPRLLTNTSPSHAMISIII